MRPAPLAPASSPQARGGCCGCFVFPAFLALFGSAVFWLGGFTAGLLLYGLAALVWGATQAAGHFFFGWRLPPLRVPWRPPPGELNVKRSDEP